MVCIFANRGNTCYPLDSVKALRMDQCAGVTPEKHLAALETMRSCQIYVE